MITSLWAAGRIEEMSLLEWSWFVGDYIVIPHTIAKKGNGKVVRIPTVIRERLESFRVERKPFAFAGCADEVERSLKTCHAVKSFSPQRMLWRMQKLIKQGALAIGRWCNVSSVNHRYGPARVERSETRAGPYRPPV